MNTERFGLLGEKLGHSFSPMIHRELGGYDYDLIELRPEELPEFLKKKEFRGVNVTIPYKQAVIPYLDRLDGAAAKIGSVNTIVREKDGSLTGYNTDAAGFRAMISQSGISPEGRKCLVFGSGGASKTAVFCLKEAGARQVVVISRRGADNYENLDRHRDAEILVNCTPVGMYPNNGALAADPWDFPEAAAALDLIYNPARTAFLLSAERMGIAAAGGLGMLTAQAAEACSLFTGKNIPASETERVTRLIRSQTENIVLIGMPGCGKTTVGMKLAEITGKKLLDTDRMIEERNGGELCGDIIRRLGEDEFRRMETEAVKEAGKCSGCVIATGGGIVTRKENLDALRQNGILVHIDRPREELPATGDRPLSETRELLEKRYRERAPLYEAWRDFAVWDASPEKMAKTILEREEKGK